MAVDIGSKAPDFTLTDQDRQPVKLSEQEGQPVVLAFFPAAFSSVCTKELCTFRDAMARLNSAKAQVYGVSVDTFFTLKAFQDAQGYNFPLLSDFNKQFFAEAYPADALDKLWWWPIQEPWYVSIRNEYQDRFLAA